jgi:hypothetical protein
VVLLSFEPKTYELVLFLLHGLHLRKAWLGFWTRCFALVELQTQVPARTICICRGNRGFEPKASSISGFCLKPTSHMFRTRNLQFKDFFGVRCTRVLAVFQEHFSLTIRRLLPFLSCEYSSAELRNYQKESNGVNQYGLSFIAKDDNQIQANYTRSCKLSTYLLLLLVEYVSKMGRICSFKCFHGQCYII